MLAVRAFRALLGVFLGTQVGRKTLMALTGLGAAAFLVVHLLGNLVVFEGATAYDRYAAGLHALPFLLAAEVGLGLLFVAHVSLGVLLFVQNLRARPVRYSQFRSAGAKTWASTTMIYTGLTVLAFMAYHVWTMRFANLDVTEFDRVREALRQPLIGIGYGIGVLAVGLHLSHGATSMLLSLGLRHPLHDPWVDLLGRIGATLLAIGFASIIFWFLVRGAPIG